MRTINSTRWTLLHGISFILLTNQYVDDVSKCLKHPPVFGLTPIFACFVTTNVWSTT